MTKNTDENSSTSDNIGIGAGIPGRNRVWDIPIPDEELPEEVQKYIFRRSEGHAEKSTLERLEGKHVMRMILYIDEMSPVAKSDIYNNITRSVNVVAKLDDLADMGIIGIYRTGKTNLNVIVITEKGRLVAQLIRDMVDEIEKVEIPTYD